MRKPLIILLVLANIRLMFYAEFAVAASGCQHSQRSKIALFTLSFMEKENEICNDSDLERGRANILDKKYFGGLSLDRVFREELQPMRSSSAYVSLGDVVITGKPLRETEASVRLETLEGFETSGDSK